MLFLNERIAKIIIINKKTKQSKNYYKNHNFITTKKTDTTRASVKEITENSFMNYL